MTACKRNARIALILLASACAGAAAMEPPSAAELTRGQSSFALREGVVLGPERATLYLLEPGGLVARSLADGSVRWRSERKRQPLGFYGDRLVVFEPASQDRQGSVSLLDPASGKLADEFALGFPDPVAPSLTGRPSERFSIASDIDGRDLIVSWAYTSVPLRGAALVDDDVPQSPAGSARGSTGSAPGVDRPLRVQGAHRIDVAARAATLVTDDGVTDQQRFEALVEIVSAGAGAGDLAQVFRSPDGRHHMRSERISRSEWNRYRWTLVDTEVGSIIGQREMPAGYAPFFVHRGKLGWISPPTTRRKSDGDNVTFEALGLRLNVVDLESGNIAWTTALADPEYRGVLPP